MTLEQPNDPFALEKSLADYLDSQNIQQPSYGPFELSLSIVDGYIRFEFTHPMNPEKGVDVYAFTLQGAKSVLYNLEKAISYIEYGE